MGFFNDLKIKHEIASYQKQLKSITKQINSTDKSAANFYSLISTKRTLEQFIHQGRTELATSKQQKNPGATYAGDIYAKRDGRDITESQALVDLELVEAEAENLKLLQDSPHYKDMIEKEGKDPYDFQVKGVDYAKLVDAIPTAIEKVPVSAPEYDQLCVQAIKKNPAMIQCVKKAPTPEMFEAVRTSNHNSKHHVIENTPGLKEYAAAKDKEEFEASVSVTVNGVEHRFDGESMKPVQSDNSANENTKKEDEPVIERVSLDEINQVKKDENVVVEDNVKENNEPTVVPVAPVVESADKENQVEVVTPDANQVKKEENVIVEDNVKENNESIVEPVAPVVESIDNGNKSEVKKETAAGGPRQHGISDYISAYAAEYQSFYSKNTGSRGSKMVDRQKRLNNAMKNLIAKEAEKVSEKEDGTLDVDIMKKVSHPINEADMSDLVADDKAVLRLFAIASSDGYAGEDGKWVKLTEKRRVALAGVLVDVAGKRMDLENKKAQEAQNTKTADQSMVVEGVEKVNE